MTTLLIVLFVVILAVPLIYLSTLKGEFVVSRSLTIGVAREQVFEKIKDFRSWPEWSPWLMHEPEAHLEYSDAPDQQGGWYSWDGETVGAGRLTHMKFSGSDKIEQKIEFLRPFKSVSQVWWELERLDEGNTQVSWNMSGSMPFLFRFMTKKSLNMWARITIPVWPCYVAYLSLVRSTPVSVLQALSRCLRKLP
ncbi:MAG: SRPBCC family protein [Candidatus Thiodiazotropha lotti]|nr:SRPBCC family protein [Candidatus Thiodiazotropha lotti]MCW4215102.1 SRPBCC family protein [Candidatus Thiodiazotropha lotti]